MQSSFGSGSKNNWNANEPAKVPFRGLLGVHKYRGSLLGAKYARAEQAEVSSVVKIVCPGQWGSPRAWRGSETVWMWHLGTWFGRHGGVGVTIGLDDLGGLF